MKKFLAIAIALALTACGGSDDNTASIQTTTTTPTTNTTTNTSTSTQTTSTSTSATFWGRSLNTDTKTPNAAYNLVNLNTNNINTLVVDGKSFTLGYPNISSYAFTDLNTQSYHSVVSGLHMSYAKYGVYNDKENNKEYFFYQGQVTPTASIPTTGNAIYKGRSIYSDNEIIKGDSAFTVDFGAKTVSGTINNTKTSVSLRATISGNSFSGTHNNTTTYGSFFGANADEISGIYSDKNKTFNGVFGAKKQ